MPIGAKPCSFSSIRVFETHVINNIDRIINLHHDTPDILISIIMTLTLNCNKEMYDEIIF